MASLNYVKLDMEDDTMVTMDGQAHHATEIPGQSRQALFSISLLFLLYAKAGQGPSHLFFAGSPVLRLKVSDDFFFASLPNVGFVLLQKVQKMQKMPQDRGPAKSRTALAIWALLQHFPSNINLGYPPLICNLSLKESLLW